MMKKRQTGTANDAVCSLQTMKASGASEDTPSICSKHDTGLKTARSQISDYPFVAPIFWPQMTDLCRINHLLVCNSYILLM